jgi:tRNA dimethylallyltransferase
MEIALIGPTACGKSETALNVAKKIDGIILSLDSLALYKEVDIASAKPSREELRAVKHFGVDILHPNEYFNAAMFVDEYKRASEYAKEQGKHLIIVGGSSFYLKVMIDGLSVMPPISKDARDKATAMVHEDVMGAYAQLQDIDAKFAEGVKSADAYRISRGLEIFYEFGKKPSEIFDTAPKKNLAQGLRIFEITADREELRAKIRARTAKMFEAGLLEEAEYLLGRYGVDAKPMGSIGLKECVSFLCEEITRAECEELISIHTGQLAKRQVTFNKTQLNAEFAGEKEVVEAKLFGLFA